MRDLVGSTIKGFKFIQLLGSGGMGDVYKAIDLELDRLVAIKVIQTNKKLSSSSLRKFQKEAKHQAKLTHPNIVTIHELIELYSSIGIVMEYVDGEDLSNIIKRKKRLEFNYIKSILIQVLDALDFAHSNGIIHRDIKPSNIITRKDGVAKIADFGIAKSVEDFENFTTNSNLIGTLFYMSPEQITGGKISQLSDIYSLACTVYEMVTGLPPFYFENKFQIISAHLKDIAVPFEYYRNDIPIDFENLIFKMLSKNPKERPKSCYQIKEVIKIIQPNEVNFQKINSNNSSNTFFYNFIKILLIILTLVIIFLVVTNVKIKD